MPDDLIPPAAVTVLITVTGSAVARQLLDAAAAAGLPPTVVVSRTEGFQIPTALAQDAGLIPRRPRRPRRSD